MKHALRGSDLLIERLVRSRRRTIAIEVHPDGSLVVRAPKRATLAEIERQVLARSDWIREAQAKARQKYAEYLVSQPHRYQPGELFYFLGQPYPLALVERTRPALTLDGAFELAQSAQARAATVFESWYREQARQVLAERTEHYARLYGMRYNDIRITGARTRWGSCNNRGGLNYSWRLVMAPLSAIDSVVVHELVHTEIHDHSPRFWQRVEQLQPDYRQRRAWLKQHAHLFTL